MPKFTDKLTPLAEAFAVLELAIEPIREEGSLPVAEAMGRVLLGDYASRIDQPPFDKAAMDGYAVLPDDQSDELEILETVAAGETPSRTLTQGTTIKVMTGAAVPEGAARVIPVEHGREEHGRVFIEERGSARNICSRGEDLSEGQVFLSGPVVAGPLEIANLAGCGNTRVRALRRPRVAILNTGDELVEDSADLAPGLILDANGPLLAALCESERAELISRRIVPDDPAATREAIAAALERADLLLISGGVSAGEFDYVGPALRELGFEIHFDLVAMKPGRPLTFATRAGGTVLGLPGNPVAVYVTFQVFVRRALRLLQQLQVEPAALRLPLAEGYSRRKTERREYLPCRLENDGRLRPLKYNGSAHVAAFLASDGLCVVEKGRGELAAGDAVDFIATGERLR